MATFANHGVLTVIANKVSSGKLFETWFISPGEWSLDIKSATWLSLPGWSRPMMLNSYINNIHLVILPFVIALFIKYLMAEWYIWMNTW